MTRKRQWQALLVSLLAVAGALSLFTLFQGEDSRPAAPARPILNIGVPAAWVDGNRCPDRVQQEACKALFPRREEGG